MAIPQRCSRVLIPGMPYVLSLKEGLESVTHSGVTNSLGPHGLQAAKLLSPWDSPGKNTGVGCPFLLQGIFLT